MKNYGLLIWIVLVSFSCGSETTNRNENSVLQQNINDSITNQGTISGFKILPSAQNMANNPQNKINNSLSVKGQKVVIPGNEPQNPIQNIVYNSDTKGNLENRQSQNISAIQNFYKTVDKAIQFYNIQVNKDTVVIGEEGTKVTIPAKTFINERTGEFITGNLTLKLQEYYKTADILLSILSTMSNSEILETGGMIYIEAYSEGEKCKIAKGKSISIGFPNKVEKENMELFNGNIQSNTINWTRDQTSFKINQNEAFKIVDEMPVFPGGDAALMISISSNVKYPGEAIDKNIEGTVFVRFVVNAQGNVSDVKVLRSPHRLLSAEAVRVVKNLPRFMPGKNRGVTVPVYYVLPVSFTINGNENAPISEKQDTSYGNETNEDDYSLELNDSNINQKDYSTDLSYYMFSTSNLGWINCDRFYNVQDKADFIVEHPFKEKLEVKIVFHKYRSILCGFGIESGFRFENVPLNENITIVAFKFENNKNYLAVQDTKTGRENFKNLEFKQVSIQNIKETLEKLNHLN